jgi:hypothetical protein
MQSQSPRPKADSPPQSPADVPPSARCIPWSCQCPLRRSPPQVHSSHPYNSQGRLPLSAASLRRGAYLVHSAHTTTTPSCPQLRNSPRPAWAGVRGPSSNEQQKQQTTGGTEFGTGTSRIPKINKTSMHDIWCLYSSQYVNKAHKFGHSDSGSGLIKTPNARVNFATWHIGFVSIWGFCFFLCILKFETYKDCQKPNHAATQKCTAEERQAEKCN